MPEVDKTSDPSHREKANHQLARQDPLLNVVTKIRESLDLETIFQTTAVEVRQLLNADRVAVFQFELETNCSRGKFVSEDVLPQYVSAISAFVEDNCFGRNHSLYYQKGYIWALNDVGKSHLQDCHEAVLNRFQVRANLVAPLLQGEQLWGLLCIHQCEGPREWEDTEIEFATKIALNLSIAIQQAQLIIQAQKRSEDLQKALAEVKEQKEQQNKATIKERALFQVIDKIRRTLDLETIFKTTATEVRQLLEADRVAIFQFIPGSEYSRGQFVSEDVLPQFPSALKAQVQDNCFGEKYAQYYTRGKIWSLDDIYDCNLNPCYTKILDRFQVRANMIAPLLIGEKLWGLLCIHQCANPRQWLDSEKEFVTKIALNLCVALQQSELLVQTRKRSEELQEALQQVEAQKENLASVAAQEKALGTVIERIRRTLDLENIFRATTEEVREILNCDRVVVYRFYEDWSGEFLYESVREEWRPLTWLPGLKTVWEDTYLQETQGGRYRYHETLAVHNIHESNLTPCHVKILEQFQVKAFAIVPVFVGENLWGLLGAYENSKARQWDEKEIGLLVQIANQLGVGVHQAQLLARTKEQSQELETTLADLNAIVDNLADGLLVTDIFGKITRFNPALLSMFNIQKINLIGKKLEDIFPMSLSQLVSGCEQEEQEVVTADVALSQNREGQALASSILKEKEQDEGSQCLGAVILIRDVTREREIDRMKTDFLANVSHELRTPLTSVLGFAALIKEKLEEVIFPALSLENNKLKKNVEKITQNINIIVSEAERLTDLITDVLDITKMESGRIEWEMKPVSLYEILQRSIAAVEPLCQQKNLYIITDYDRELPCIIGDENRLIQVVINLLSNAIKFTDQGEIVCQARLEKGEVLVRVKDKGMGIALENTDIIFDRFKQVGNILTSKPKGTGLGLPICKQIVEYHGGTIWVESCLGEGSIFAFTLPISHEAREMYNEIKSVNDLFKES
ncbi:MAG: Adaptive-response sensory-kinase SasA [Chroococcopsis gigantea SAG 12.99]|jgi:PAS domain S-box-containing protein|nr:GAF domain-containing protein [Chlorogloea purpurea SAG 13.99]MDV3001547.1 Adaptive-response sensory-kinase SasA [Chroococcopsis gigantea SAG 12.99]